MSGRQPVEDQLINFKKTAKVSSKVFDSQSVFYPVPDHIKCNR